MVKQKPPIGLRLCWFAALWLAGVACVTLLAWFIRLWIA